MKLAVLIPTRARVDSVKRTLSSFAAMTKDERAVEVFVGVDLDDTATLELVEQDHQPGRIRVHYRTMPRPDTLGAVTNNLWRAGLETGCDLFMYGADDIEIATPDWEQVVFSAFAQVPDRLLLAYVIDPTASMDIPTYGIVSRELTMHLGYVISEWFPFWWADVWLDEIALFMGRKMKLPVMLRMQDGKGRTHRLRDLAFWARFFEETRPERIEVAERLSGRPVNPALVSLLERRNAPNCDPERAAQIEAALRLETRAPDEGYLRAKGAAEAHLRGCGIDVGAIARV
jgi:hypothetical protein